MILNLQLEYQIPFFNSKKSKDEGKILFKLFKHKKFNLNDFNLTLKFSSTNVIVRSKESNKIIYDLNLSGEYDSIQRDKKKKNSFVLSKNKQKIMTLTFQLLYTKGSVSTESEYVLYLGRTENTIFYVGLYEFGTLKFNEQGLAIEKRVKHDSVYWGAFDDDSKSFILSRGKNGIESWNWNKEYPEKNWELPDLDVIKGLLLEPSRTILAGTSEGKILQINLKGKLIKEYFFESEAIRYMIWMKGCICLTKKNFIYKFNLEGKLQWKIKLKTEKSNNNAYYYKNKLYVVTDQSVLWILNPENGKIKEKHFLVKDIESPITIFRNNWLIYASLEKIQGKLLSSKNISDFSVRFTDKIMRALLLVDEKTILVGDDDGKIVHLQGPMFKFGVPDNEN